jgi:hypothetical protein
MKRSRTKEDEEELNEMAVSAHKTLIDVRRWLAESAEKFEGEKFIRFIVGGLVEHSAELFERKWKRRVSRDSLRETKEEVIRRVLLLDRARPN